MNAAEWLAAESDGAPPVLRGAMLSALPESESRAPVALVDASMDLFAQLVASDGTRRDALPLLAADALLTHAFAAAEPGDVPQLANAALARLGQLAAGISPP